MTRKTPRRLGFVKLLCSTMNAQVAWGAAFRRLRDPAELPRNFGRLVPPCLINRPIQAMRPLGGSFMAVRALAASFVELRFKSSPTRILEPSETSVSLARFTKQG